MNPGFSQTRHPLPLASAKPCYHYCGNLRVEEFCPQEENVASYVMRLKHYFKVNQIKEENKVSVLITIIGPKVHAVVKRPPNSALNSTVA
ncbi:hypothetical protein PR048_017504 [Dryococelus australis]|uniref:Uncharacterized protein n=1 Tax=Dryococelus australis TaxID=614101 RepID=A0ABQ9H9Z9_9NEOP|nr:hypothetical protein PR048_017504 [Dryococelus australis]